MVTPAAAAVMAGRDYVYRTSFRKGLEDGWRAGWRAGMELVKRKEVTVGTTSVDEEGQEVLLELDEKWARRFALAELRRKQENERRAAEDDTSGAVEMDLGGRQETRRRRRKEELYGHRAEEIMTLEAEMDEKYGAAIQQQNAPLWPVLPLRERF